MPKSVKHFQYKKTDLIEFDAICLFQDVFRLQWP